MSLLATLVKLCTSHHLPWLRSHTVPLLNIRLVLSLSLDLGVPCQQYHGTQQCLVAPGIKPGTPTCRAYAQQVPTVQLSRPHRGTQSPGVQDRESWGLLHVSKDTGILKFLFLGGVAITPTNHISLLVGLRESYVVLRTEPRSTMSKASNLPTCPVSEA